LSIKEWLTYLIASYIKEKFSGLIIMESNKTRLDKDDNLTNSLYKFILYVYIIGFVKKNLVEKPYY